MIRSRARFGYDLRLYVQVLRGTNRRLIDIIERVLEIVVVGTAVDSVKL